MSRRRCDICDDSLAYAGDYCPACALPARPHDPDQGNGWPLWLGAAIVLAALAAIL